MRISSKGLELIKHFEGCKLKAYRCSAGVLTIGYGHTGEDVKEGMTIDQAKADALLYDDVIRFERGVNQLLFNIKQCQFDALVSFAFNLGLGNLKSSTLLKKILANDYDAAADQFLRWNKAGGKVLAGLTKRREAERALFLGMS